MRLEFESLCPCYGNLSEWLGDWLQPNLQRFESVGCLFSLCDISLQVSRNTEELAASREWLVGRHAGTISTTMCRWSNDGVLRRLQWTAGEMGSRLACTELLRVRPSRGPLCVHSSTGEQLAGSQQVVGSSPTGYTAGLSPE